MVPVGDLFNPTATITTAVAANPVAVATATQRPLPTRTPVVQQAIPTATPLFATGRIGDRLTSGNYILTVNGAEKSQSYNSFSNPKPGNEYLAVDVTIESASNRDVSTSASYVTLQDSAGFRYEYSLLGKEPGLPSENPVPLGSKVRGWITFEVPKTATGLVLSFKPALDIIRFNVNLG
jgi:hypothetical protein